MYFVKLAVERNTKSCSLLAAETLALSDGDIANIYILLKEFIDNKSVTKIHDVPGQNQLANVVTIKGASSKELLHTLSKEFFHFNWIFTILCSVTIVALKFMY